MSHSLGFVVLAHDEIVRLRQTIQYLAEDGTPIAVHLDKKVSNSYREMLHYAFQGLPNVILVEPIEVHWGSWSIVQATLNSIKALRSNFPELKYIANLSGSCLPLNSPEEMRDILALHAYPTDFIENYSTAEKKWVRNGLDVERFTLYHPFYWRSQRRRFDFNVRIQRLLRVKRTAPVGLEVAFGSQWWCLSTKTIDKILNSPELEKFCSFFQTTWIPDESFFQSMARLLSGRIINTSTTYSNFDFAGKPFIFYDDHREFLSKLDYFFARKVWQGSEGLYRYFLNAYRPRRLVYPMASKKFQESLDEVSRGVFEKKQGLVSQFTLGGIKGNKNAARKFHVLFGWYGFEKYVEKNHDSKNYKFEAQLFKRQFFGHAKAHKAGMIRDNQTIRDYNPRQFLLQRIWHTPNKELVYAATFSQKTSVLKSIDCDSMAKIYWLWGGWIPNFLNRKFASEKVRKSVACALCRQETKLFREIEIDLRIPIVWEKSVGELLESDLKVYSEIPFLKKGTKFNLTLDSSQLEILRDDIGEDAFQKYRLDHFISSARTNNIIPFVANGTRVS